MTAAMTSAGVPLDPSRDQARQWAADELAGREYAQAEPGVVQRLFSWVFDRLADLFSSFDSAPNPFGALAVGVVVLLLAVLVALAVRRFGGPGGLRAAHPDDPVFGDRGPLSAAEHRALAARAETDGDWQTSVLERFRALARELEERTVLAPRPGRTAGELSAEISPALPDAAAAVALAARVFDEVRYGGRTASSEAASAVRAADEAVRSAEPVLG